MRQFLAILVTTLLVQSATAQSLWRNFFTTNRDPIVEVVAGSNATVQATTVGSNLRRFTVNSTATGGGFAQTNISYEAVTNAPWQTGSANLTNWSGISTNLAAFLANNQVFTGSNTFTQTITGNGGGLTNVTSRTPFFVGAGSQSAGVSLSSTARYSPLFGGGYISSTEANATGGVPIPCTITNLYVKFQTTIGTGTNVTFTIMTNGVASGITCSILGNGTTGTAATNTTAYVTIPAGSTASLRYVSTDANSISVLFSWTFCYY